MRVGRVSVVLAVLLGACPADPFDNGDGSVDAGVDTMDDVPSDIGQADVPSDVGYDAADATTDVPEDMGEDTTVPACVSGDECDDENACTLGERCDDAGECNGGTPADCSPRAEARCEGDERVVRSLMGTCQPATGCDFSETREDCLFGCVATVCADCVETTFGVRELTTVEPTGTVGDDVIFDIDADGTQHLAFIENRLVDGNPQPSVFHGTRSSDSADFSEFQVFAPGPGWSQVDMHVQDGVVYLMAWASFESRWYLAVRRAGTWTTSIFDYGYRTDIDMDVTDDGVLHVLTGGNAIEHHWWDGTSWQQRNTPSAGFELTLTHEGNELFAAYRLRGDNSLGFLYWNGTSWETDQLASMRVENPVVRHRFDTTFVLYRVDDRVMLTFRGDVSGWGPTLPLSSAVERNGDELALDVDVFGNIHVAYRDMQRFRVVYQTAAPGGFFASSVLDERNGFSLNLHSDDAGRVRWVDRAVGEIFEGDLALFGIRQACEGTM